MNGEFFYVFTEVIRITALVIGCNSPEEREKLCGVLVVNVTELKRLYDEKEQK